MKTFETVKTSLESKGVKFEEVHFTDTAISARTEDTSVDHNYDPESAIKTLIVSTKEGYKGVILKGSDRIDQSKLKSIIGKWQVVDSDTLQKEFGFAPGTICPIGLDIPIFIDETAIPMKVWSMGAGAVDKGVNIAVEEVLKHLPFYKTCNFRQN